MNDDDGRVQIVAVWLWREGEGGGAHFEYGSDETHVKMRTNGLFLFPFHV
jgi:hypothetical protein